MNAYFKGIQPFIIIKAVTDFIVARSRSMDYKTGGMFWDLIGDEGRDELHAVDAMRSTSNP